MSTDPMSARPRPSTAAEATVRMEPLAVLPVFLKLGDRRVVMVGGSSPAVWKAELLSATGARVDLYDPAPCPELIELAADPPGGAITLVARAWAAEDLAGAAVAIGVIDDETEADAFRRAAGQAGVPVNVVDKPLFCDFQFGTVVSRSPLVIGISTDGAAPVFGQAIRARIEALLPQGLRQWAIAAKEWRAGLQTLGLGFRGRRRFWEKFTELALTSPDAVPSEQDRALCLAEATTGAGAAEPGRLTLVGDGSGDPDLITLGTIRALQSADHVLHGPRVSPVIIGFARREAEKTSFCPPLGQVASGLAPFMTPGRHVVWLDGGNPARCLRWTERRRELSNLDLRIGHQSSLGRCEACRPHCPAWTT